MTKSLSAPVRRVKADAGPETSLYERIGAEKVERLVVAFYARVESDPVIRPLYGKTLSCAIRGLTDFMTTWLGGPQVYDLPGARLRRRHVPFAIDARARDAWLANMKAAVMEVGIPAAEAALLITHLEFGATALVNTSKSPKSKHCPVGSDCFDERLAEPSVPIIPGTVALYSNSVRGGEENHHESWNQDPTHATYTPAGARNGRRP